jgi:uncharacterized membrane protein
MIQLMIFNKISRWHLFHIIIIFFFFYLYSHGKEFKDHGYYNFLFYVIVLGAITILLIPIDIILYFIKKHNNDKTLSVIYFLLLMSLSFSLYIYFIKICSNCIDWEKGLNNTVIDNDENKYGCQIVFPRRCTYKIFQEIQD